MIARRLVLLAALLAGCAASSGGRRPDRDTYEIRLDRPPRLGAWESIKVSHSSRLGRVMRKGDQILNREEVIARVEYDGTVRAMQLDASGRTVRAEYQVRRLTLDEGSGPQEVLREGDVVLLDRGDKEAPLRLGGGALPPLAEKALKEFINTGSTHRSDDEIFGTQERQRVGASWPMNAAMAAADLGPTLTVRPEDLSGRTKLVAVGPSGGVDCMTLRGEMTARKVAMPSLPPEAVLDSSAVRADFVGVFPVEPTRARLLSELRMSGQFRLHVSANGQQVDVDLDMTKATLTEIAAPH